MLDEGRYLGSERTRYRILSARQPVRERRNPLTHPRYAKPELVARAPNPVWSWDITRLLGPKTGSSFYLYVRLDLFSRYGVGWRVAERESAALASRLIEESCLKQGIQPRVLTLHSDRGAPMTSQCTAQLLAQLGITLSLCRPRVRDDNPFCRSFFPWYNTQHHHAGLAMLTPDDVHHGRARQRIEQRRRTLGQAWGRHPERFVQGKSKPRALPETVWINPPKATPTVGDAQYMTTLAVSTALTGSAERANLGDTMFDIYLNGEAFWRNVPAAVWAYRLGGYQVLKKWLSYRERTVFDRPLLPGEVQHFADTARRIASIPLLAEADLGQSAPGGP